MIAKFHIDNRNRLRGLFFFGFFVGFFCGAHKPISMGQDSDSIQMPIFIRMKISSNLLNFSIWEALNTLNGRFFFFLGVGGAPLTHSKLITAFFFFFPVPLQTNHLRWAPIIRESCKTSRRSEHQTWATLQESKVSTGHSWMGGHLQRGHRWGQKRSALLPKPEQNLILVKTAAVQGLCWTSRDSKRVLCIHSTPVGRRQPVRYSLPSDVIRQQSIPHKSTQLERTPHSSIMLSLVRFERWITYSILLQSHLICMIIKM